MGRKINLIDTTLRDGAQAPHVTFTLADKLHIVKMLSNAGISIFEAGIPAMGKSECQEISSLIQYFPGSTFIAWCRADVKDIEMAHECGCKSIHISFPVSSQHMSIQTLSEGTVLESLQKILQMAKIRFASVSIGAQDASRASMLFLEKFVKLAFDGGAARIRIADTIGILSPLMTMEMFRQLTTVVPGKALEFHGHNDLGMATANTIVALQSGADYASVTVNGVGERAGNAPLEEVVMAIKESTDLEVDFDISSINTLCREVSKIVKQPVSKTKPITGEFVFCHESGIHCNGQLKNPSAYEPFDPSITGHAESSFVAGTHSGKAGLMAILNRHGIVTSYDELETLLPVIKECSKSIRKSLNEEETVMLYTLFKYQRGSVRGYL